MKAALLKKWEDMQVIDIEKPKPDKDEALIRVIYAGVCGSDITVYSGKHPTATAPVVVGHEILGIVEEINSSKPLNFKAGDRVTVEPLISCGVCEACIKGYKHVCRSLKLLGIHENGGYAEYTKVSVDKVVKVDDDIPDRIAALAEPFAVGFHVISRSNLRLGDSALIIGAGPIGLIIAITASFAGASRIVISEVNENRRKLAEKLGFETIDPTKEDPMEAVNRYTNNTGFDVVFEVSGSKAGALLTKSCLLTDVTGVEYLSLLGK
jgi:threonine dehydrogenase-like Zn-dependent dehydrogenase